MMKAYTHVHRMKLGRLMKVYTRTQDKTGPNVLAYTHTHG